MRRLLTILGGIALLTVLLIPVTGQAQGQSSGVPAEVGTPAPDPTGSEPTGPTPSGSDVAVRPVQSGGLTPEQERGQELYFNNCVSCHGSNFRGIEGNGPSLYGRGGAAVVDYVLRTGRMPLPAPDAVPRRGPAVYNEEDTQALVAFLGDQLGDTEIPTANVSDEAALRGRELYMNNCASCHGAGGAGAPIGGGYYAPSLEPVEADTVAKAMRVGPGRMPVFAGEAWSQEEVDAVSSYVLTLGEGESDRGGLPLGALGPVAEGYIAWVVGLLLIIVVVRVIGKTAPRRRPAPAAVAAGTTDDVHTSTGTSPDVTGGTVTRATTVTDAKASTTAPSDQASPGSATPTPDDAKASSGGATATAENPKTSTTVPSEGASPGSAATAAVDDAEASTTTPSAENRTAGKPRKRAPRGRGRAAQGPQPDSGRNADGDDRDDTR